MKWSKHSSPRTELKNSVFIDREGHKRAGRSYQEVMGHFRVTFFARLGQRQRTVENGEEGLHHLPFGRIKAGSSPGPLQLACGKAAGVSLQLSPMLR